MSINDKIVPVVAALTLLGSGIANAALMDGNTDASHNTSVFISVVERDGANAVLRNLLIDTGTRTLATFALTPWSTTSAQETQILGFLTSAGAGSTVAFNIGGGLNDQSFTTDLYGFVTTGTAPGPGTGDFSALGSAVTNIDTHIGDANFGTFNAAGIEAANAATDRGWHNVAWGNDVAGAIAPSNEILFGQNGGVLGWKTQAGTFEIIRHELGQITSNASTGDISFTAVPLPGVAWLLVPAFGLLARRRRPAMLQS